MYLPVYQIRCEGCGKHFDWTPKQQVTETPPNYHNRTCRNRNRERLRDSIPTKCPHPNKRVYPTHEAAMRAINQMQDPYMKPYRCRCGAIHIGHPYIRIRDWIEA